MKQELTTSKIVETNNNKKDRRSGKGRVIALSRRVYRLLNTDVFYVESESSDNIYYFVKYKPDVLEFCSCKDYESNRVTRCKHIFGVEFAIRMGTLKDTEKLPAEAKRYPHDTIVVTTTESPKSYRDDNYDF
jgi:predicted nucleic acid-binding Zn finger protein